MVEALKLKVSEVVRMLNSSCQSGGHYLKDSELAVAALASIVATSKLAAKGKNDERNQIITKVIKQYLNHKKAYTASVFTALSRVATGGVPTDMEPSKLIKIYNVNKEIGKVSKLDAVAASRLTEVNIVGSRLAGQIYDEENEEYSRVSSMGMPFEEMESIALRNTQEEEMIKQALAESLVIKKYRPDPAFKTMIYTPDSEMKLHNFAKEKGLSNKVPLNYLEEMYNSEHSGDYRFVAAKQMRGRIEHELTRVPVTSKSSAQQMLREDLADSDEINQQSYRQEEVGEEGYINTEEEEVADGGNDEEMVEESTSHEPQVSNMPSKPDISSRKKRPSESDLQEDPKLPKMDSPRVTPSTSDIPMREVAKGKMSKTDIRLSKNQEGFLKVQSFLSQEKIDLLVKSFAELSSNLKTPYEEMAKLQGLLKDNKVAAEEREAEESKIRMLSNKCSIAQNALDERANTIRELGSRLSINTTEVNDLINHIRGVEKAKHKSAQK